VATYLDETEAKFFREADARDLSDEVGRNRAYLCISILRGLVKYLTYCSSELEDAERQFQELLKPSNKPRTGGVLGG